MSKRKDMMSTHETHDDIQVHEGRRTGMVVSVRLKPDEADLLSALAERDGRSLSETLRVALHTFATTPDVPAMSRVDEHPVSTRGDISQNVPYALAAGN